MTLTVNIGKFSFSCGVIFILLITLVNNGNNIYVSLQSKVCVYQLRQQCPYINVQHATGLKVDGSIPDEALPFFFNLPNPSSSTRLWGLLSL
jgi:hypothetical protein